MERLLRRLGKKRRDLSEVPSNVFELPGEPDFRTEPDFGTHHSLLPVLDNILLSGSCSLYSPLFGRKAVTLGSVSEVLERSCCVLCRLIARTISKCSSGNVSGPGRDNDRLPCVLEPTPVMTGIPTISVARSGVILNSVIWPTTLPARDGRNVSISIRSRGGLKFVWKTIRVNALAVWKCLDTPVT